MHPLILQRLYPLSGWSYAGSSGHVEFSGLKESVYTLKVLATNRKPDKELIRRKFEVTADPNRCTLHFINNGVTVTAETATVEFAGRGPVEEYWCRVNQEEYFVCTCSNKLHLIIHQITYTYCCL